MPDVNGRFELYKKIREKEKPFTHSLYNIISKKIIFFVHERQVRALN
jgi:hypothetical protein